MSKYKITASNRHIAYNYLVKKLSDNKWLDEVFTYKEDMIVRQELDAGLADERALNEWCEKYLNDKQYNALRSAIRKSLSRSSLKKEAASVSISHESYKKISKLAKRKKVSIKAMLEQVINDL